MCDTGTYSLEIGSTDLSLCYPCPKGRVCGTPMMVNLDESSPCPAGYICGFGTDRTRQFTHKTPGGFHSSTETTPENQFGSKCKAGYYCQRGTSTVVELRARCTVGYYCPVSTPTGNALDVKCPKGTTSLSGTESVQGCRITEINVCDKIAIDPIDPFNDVTYLPKYNYDLLDDSGLNLAYDSGKDAAVQTGEIRVQKKIQITNETSSVPFWTNDTVEVFVHAPLW